MTLSTLAIYSSPRAGGNSDLLMKEFLRGVAEYGSEIDEMYLRNLSMSPCMECGSCNETGKCVVTDDMQMIYPKLESAHRVVMTSPVFFYGVTAQLKAMIDRCQALWCKNFYLKEIHPPEITGRKGYFLSVAGTRGKQVFDCSVMTVRIFFESVGISFQGYLGYRSIDHKGAILEHPEALNEAYEAGKKFGSE